MNGQASTYLDKANEIRLGRTDDDDQWQLTVSRYGNGAPITATLFLTDDQILAAAAFVEANRLGDPS